MAPHKAISLYGKMPFVVVHTYTWVYDSAKAHGSYAKERQEAVVYQPTH